MVCWPGCGVRLVAVRWLSAPICAAEFFPVAGAVKAANTAIDCSCERIACSLACAPYWTVTAWSTRADDEARAEPGPELPVYQVTVLAGVPLISVVAELSEAPPTRSGGSVAVVVPPLKPSAWNAAEFELETVSGAPLLDCSVITPPWTVDGVAVPVRESMVPSRLPTVVVARSR